ncbi:MAG: RadC family protein [Niabella sp.]
MQRQYLSFLVIYVHCGMEIKNTIKQWARDDRPREKLIALGSDKLSNSELIAILIHNGTTKKSALDLAREILKLGNDDITQLGKLSLKELTSVKGIGEAKAVTIAAALELGRRRQAEEKIQKRTASNAHDTALFLQEKFKDLVREIFAVLYLNQANKILNLEVISEGGITGTIADVRIILRKAIEKGAVNIILCHNHPSGNLKPSKADELLTEKLQQAAALMDIRVLDHIIVSDEGYFSFADEGLI